MDLQKKFKDQILSTEMMSMISGGTVTRLLCTNTITGGYGYYFYNNETGSLRNLLGSPVSLCDVENCGCGPEL